MVVDAAVIWTGDRAQLHSAVVSLKRLDLLSPVVGEAILQVDTCQRRRQLAQIGSGRTDERRQLPETPVGRRDRLLGTGQDQVEPLGIVATRFDPDRRTFDRACAAALGAAFDRCHQRIERQITLVGGTTEPFRRYPTDPLAATDIDLVAAAPVGARVENLNLCHDMSPRRSGQEPLSRHSNRHGDSRRPLPFENLHVAHRPSIPKRNAITRFGSDQRKSRSSSKPQTPSKTDANAISGGHELDTSPHRRVSYPPA